jgi:hypothetical protein
MSNPGWPTSVPFAGTLLSQPFNPDLSLVSSLQPARPFASLRLSEGVAPHRHSSTPQASQLAPQPSLLPRPMTTASVMKTASANPSAGTIQGPQLSPPWPLASNPKKKRARRGGAGAQIKHRRLKHLAASGSGSQGPLAAAGSAIGTIASGAERSGTTPVLPSPPSSQADTSIGSGGIVVLSQSVESASAVLAKLLDLIKVINDLPSLEDLQFLDSYPEGDPAMIKSNWYAATEKATARTVKLNFETKREILRSKRSHKGLLTLGLNEWFRDDETILTGFHDTVLADWYQLVNVRELRKGKGTTLSNDAPRKTKERKLAREHAQHLMGLLCTFSDVLPMEGLLLPDEPLKKAADAMRLLMDRINSLQHWKYETLKEALESEHEAEYRYLG